MDSAKNKYAKKACTLLFVWCKPLYVSPIKTYMLLSEDGRLEQECKRRTVL